MSPGLRLVWPPEPAPPGPMPERYARLRRACRGVLLDEGDGGDFLAWGLTETEARALVGVAGVRVDRGGVLVVPAWAGRAAVSALTGAGIVVSVARKIGEQP